MNKFDFICKAMFYAVAILLIFGAIVLLISMISFLVINYPILCGILVFPMILYGAYKVYDDIKDHRPLKID